MVKLSCAGDVDDDDDDDDYDDDDDDDDDDDVTCRHDFFGECFKGLLV